jgi:pimeloyl-ACP methyl ester carboxylesterase
VLAARVPRSACVLGGHEPFTVWDEQRVLHGDGWWRKRRADRLLRWLAVAVEHIRINTRGFEFDALAAGPKTGELALLLHGFPQSSECWRAALGSLSRAGIRAVAPDQRGYSPGANPDEVDAYRVSELRDDVLAIASELGAQRFHLIGHDWGGTVAWAVAGEHADRVATLTAVSTAHTAALNAALRHPRQRARMAYIPLLQLPRAAEVLFDAGGGALVEAALTATGLSRAHARRDIEMLRRVGPTGALNWYRAIAHDAVRHTADVTVPTLHIWGTRDVAFGREAIELTARHVSGAYHLLELEGGTHWIPDEHWPDVADIVLEHLQAHHASRPTAKR